MALASYTALIGTSDAIEPQSSLDDLAGRFAFDKISTAPARFDPEELKALNAKLLHTTPYDRVAARLEQLGIDGGAGVLVGRARQSHGARRCRRLVARRQRRRRSP